MTPAVKIYRNAKGEWLPHDVQLHYSRPARLDDACAKVREGRTVFVAPEDADAVIEAAKGAGDSGEIHGKRIYQIDPVSGEVLNVFDCLSLALEHIGRRSSGSLSECATGKRKTAYGYKWAYSLD